MGQGESGGGSAVIFYERRQEKANLRKSEAASCFLPRSPKRAGVGRLPNTTGNGMRTTLQSDTLSSCTSRINCWESKSIKAEKDDD